jgi:hypothetical protein
MIQPGTSNTQFHPNPDPAPRVHAAGKNALNYLLSMIYINFPDLGYCVAKTQFSASAKTNSTQTQPLFPPHCDLAFYP